MKKTVFSVAGFIAIIFFQINIVSGQTIGALNNVAQALNQLRPLCQQWTDWGKQQKDISGKQTDRTKGYVCTELLEGVPLQIANQKGSSCYPLLGGKWEWQDANGNGKKEPKHIGIGENNTTRICYALITPTGLKAVAVYIAMVYTYTGWAIGILALLGIIIAGFRIVIGAAVPDQVTEGRKMIAKIIGGVVLYFLVGVILRTINPNFFT